MRNLRSVIINGNRLDFLPSNAFRGLERLHNLELADCGLNNLNYRWFDDLEFLSTLEIDLNNFQQLPMEIFDLPRLSHVGVAGNRLTELNSNAFGQSISSLITLRAENNEIDAIDENIINNASELFSLNLAGNVCVDLDFIEVQENIDAVRDRLVGCFENFVNREGSKIAV